MSKKKINTLWERVVSTPPPDEELERRKANDNILNDTNFNALCRGLNIKPTRRQASKFNNKKGIVYNNRNANKDNI